MKKKCWELVVLFSIFLNATNISPTFPLIPKHLSNRPQSWANNWKGASQGNPLQASHCQEKQPREKEIWISRAYRETQTLNPEKTDGQPKKIKQQPLENQTNPETLENPRVFLSLEAACNYRFFAIFCVGPTEFRPTRCLGDEFWAETRPSRS